MRTLTRKFSTSTLRVLALLVGSSVLLAACGGGGGGSGSNPAPTLAVGGTVSGLAGGSVVLRNNGGNDLTVSANGSFTFTNQISSGASYAVTVATNPASPAQTCTVASGSGNASANVTNIAVTCTTNTYAVGGTVSGLTGAGLVLQNNAGNNLSVSASGAFTFTTSVASGGAYAVTILTQPAGQVCSLANGSGTIAAAAVTNVSVTCSSSSYSVSGTIAGLAGSGLILQNNASNNQTPAAGATTFVFPAQSNTTPYAVTVSTNPISPSQTCTVANGSGTGNSGVNVTNVAVTCVTRTFAVNVTVSGLTGTGLVLQNNAGNNLAISASGAFTFTTPIAVGATYAVTVLTQPTTPAQTCTVTNGSGTAGASNVTNVAVSCATSYTVGGSVKGLPAGTNVVLQNNLANNLTVSANGVFTFTTPVAVGGAYAVTVLTQPTTTFPTPARVCDVKTGTGTIAAANVTTVNVICHSKYAYLANRSGIAGIASYTVGANGQLTLVQHQSENSALQPGANAADANGVAISPSGTKALVTVDADISDPARTTTSGILVAYQINADGTMVRVPTTTARW